MKAHLKSYILLITLGLLYGCKSKEEVKPNTPPQAFKVSTTLQSDGKTIVLNWTKAKDSEGDEVSYAVVLKDTLAKGLKDTTYTLKTLSFNYEQEGKIIAKDAKGLTTESVFKATTAKKTVVTIPDAKFEKYLVDKKIDKDAAVNGQIEAADAVGVKELYIDGKGITNLKGIEAFKNLELLSCTENQLTALDVSQNTALESLWCSSNKLSSLILNSSLKDLECAINELKDIDVSKNTALTFLSVGFNKISSLNLKNNSKLIELQTQSNPLTNLDISACKNLEILIATNNQLGALNLSSNIALKDLNCSSNPLKSIDLSKNINLEAIGLINTQLKELNIKNNKLLLRVDCRDNIIEALDVSSNTNLKYLFCQNNKLAKLDISKNANLAYLDCTANLLSTICVADVSKALSNKNWLKDSKAEYKVCQ